MTNDHESNGRSSGADPDADPPWSRCAWTGGDSVSTEVVRAVAEATGTHPTDLETPLAERVDTDALDELFEPADDASDPTRRGVWFHFADHRVLVHGDGEVEVRQSSSNADADTPRTRPSADDR